jgi:hypothetical protein
MSSDTSRIRVISSDKAEATREATHLRNHLAEALIGGVTLTIVKEDSTTQDTGATLILALGAPAIVSVANGIGDWIRKRRIGSSFTLDINGVHISAAGEIADHPEQLEKLISSALKTTVSGV